MRATFSIFSLIVAFSFAGSAYSASADPILDAEEACKYFLAETLKKHSDHPYRDFKFDMQLATDGNAPELGRYYTAIWSSVSAIEGDWKDTEPLDGQDIGVFVENGEVWMHVECLADLNDRRVLTIQISGSGFASEDQLPKLKPSYGDSFYPSISFDVGSEVHQGKY